MMTKEKPKYTGIATATGGRNGNVKTNDGILDLKVSTPKEFDGQESGYTNPEQLFAAAWASCFDNAILLIAKARKLEITTATTVEVTFGANDAGEYGLSAKIKVKIDGLPSEKAEIIIKSAHKVCPYSKATKGNVPSEVLLIS